MELAQIASVYKGKINKCHCGCSGKHSTNQATISRIFKTLRDNKNTVYTPFNAYLETDRHSIVAYYKD